MPPNSHTIFLHFDNTTLPILLDFSYFDLFLCKFLENIVQYYFHFPVSQWNWIKYERKKPETILLMFSYTAPDDLLMFTL